jgi:hypothetical protein
MKPRVITALLVDFFLILSFHDVLYLNEQCMLFITTEHTLSTVFIQSGRLLCYISHAVSVLTF